MATYTEEDQAKLDAASSAAVAETLVLRDDAAGCSCTQIELADVSPAGSPSVGVWIESNESRVNVREPNGVVDGPSYVDASSGGTTKLHWTYMGRGTAAAGSLATALTIPGASLPSGAWSGHITARVHAYDTVTDRMHKLTREAGVRRTAGAIVVPTQTQPAGPEQNEGEVANAVIQAVSGDIVIRVLHPKSSSVAWSIWVELFLVEH